ncbi:hypothetical protein NBRC116495_06930 [Aurantivibrio plasticivorans]
MSDESNPTKDSGNGLYDALAAAGLLVIIITTVVFWVSSQ